MCALLIASFVVLYCGTHYSSRADRAGAATPGGGWKLDFGEAPRLVTAVMANGEPARHFLPPTVYAMPHRAIVLLLLLLLLALLLAPRQDSTALRAC